MLESLREGQLIKYMLLVFILPNAILGILALFIPYAYAVIPVYETDQCMYYYKTSGLFEMFGVDSLCQALTIMLINFCIFITLNWL